MAEGPERRTGGQSAGADARALREPVDLGLARPGDRHLPDRPGLAIPDAGRRVAYGLSHTLANAPRRQAAARATRRRGPGRGESRLHVRGGLCEGFQADAWADAR